jgi:hypothetical protein
MNKITVETTADFMLLDIFGGQSIEAAGPTTVDHTDFVINAIENGQLKVITGEEAEAAPEAPVLEPVILVEPVVEPVVEPAPPPVSKPSSGKASTKKA